MFHYIQTTHTRRRGRRRALQLLFAVALGATLMLMAVYAPLAHAATITVNTTTDELNTDGDCSLREAIRAARLLGVYALYSELRQAAERGFARHGFCFY